MTLAMVTVVAAGALAGGGVTPGAQASLPEPVAPYPIDATADYQLGGAYPPPTGVTVTVRDWRDPAPIAGYGVCYVNAFQTQPESMRWWRHQHPELLLRSASGRFLEDPGWPGEILLDVSTPGSRRGLATVIDRWLDRCASGGFDAVEPDNLDSWTRSHGLLSRGDAIAMAQVIAAAAHRRGLAVAQKNAVELVGLRAAIGFDYVAVEDCQAYHECGRYQRGYGDAMLEIEYSDAAGVRGFRRACERRGARISIVYRDRDLTRPGQPGYRYASC